MNSFFVQLDFRAVETLDGGMDLIRNSIGSTVMLTVLLMGTSITASASDFTLGAGVLYVPEGDDGYSGDPAIDGTPIESGVAYVLNGSLPLGEALKIQVEGLYYESETKKSQPIPGVGIVDGTLDLEGLGGFLNVLFDLGSLTESDWLILEVGGGIGYASFKNTVTTSVAGFSTKASDKDEALGWQAIANLGYRFNPTFQLGVTGRYLGFDDLRWEDSGRVVEANNIHTFAVGGYLAFSF